MPLNVKAEAPAASRVMPVPDAVGSFAGAFIGIPVSASPYQSKRIGTGNQPAGIPLEFHIHFVWVCLMGGSAGVRSDLALMRTRLQPNTNQPGEYPGIIVLVGKQRPTPWRKFHQTVQTPEIPNPKHARFKIQEEQNHFNSSQSVRKLRTDNSKKYNRQPPPRYVPVTETQ